MLSQLEQACKTYSTESSSGLIKFDSNRQCIFVTALTFFFDQSLPYCWSEEQSQVFIWENSVQHVKLMYATLLGDAWLGDVAVLHSFQQHFSHIRIMEG